MGNDIVTARSQLVAAERWQATRREAWAWWRSYMQLPGGCNPTTLEAYDNAATELRRADDDVRQCLSRIDQLTERRAA